MPSVMPDSREPVPITLGFAISHWGRPGELAATGAAGVKVANRVLSMPLAFLLRAHSDSDIIEPYIRHWPGATQT